MALVIHIKPTCSLNLAHSQGCKGFTSENVNQECKDRKGRHAHNIQKVEVVAIDLNFV